MPNNTYYVFDGKKCLAEGMTKEQTLNAIAEATGATPQSIDEGFITTIVETNRQRSLHIWKGTNAEYNAIATPDTNTLYIIEDDTTIDEIQASIDALDAQVADMAEYLDRIVVSDRQTVSTWDSNSSGEFYDAGYLYKADITVSGCTSDHTGEVIFAIGTAATGNLASVFETGTNKITIYSRTNDTAYVDRIEVYK